MPPKHQFTAAADGTPLAYRVAGPEDGPAIVFTNGYATSDFYWKSLARHLQEEARVITWDLKGHGRSGAARDLQSVTIADSADDLRRIMDAAGVDSATLAGFSLGCQITFEAWRHFPDRIRAMIPILGTYGRPFDSLLHPALGRSLYAAFRTAGPRAAPFLVASAYFGLKTPVAHTINQTFGMVGRNVGRTTMQPFYDHFALIDPKTWVAMGIAAQDHTARDLLPQIDVPVLIIAGGRDLLTPNRLSHEMLDLIPNADLLTLPHATHSGLFEFPEEISHAVDSFLRAQNLLEHAAPASAVAASDV